MKVHFIVFLLVVITLTSANHVFAHQPRIVSGSLTEIKNPGVSQAFYATLAGAPDEYQIQAETELALHVSLLVPDLPDTRKDFLLEVFAMEQDGRPQRLVLLDGKKHTWDPFYEPFTGDSYLQGPETDRTLPAGKYRIFVSNPQNEGKYVLSVGRQEKFTFSEAIQTVRRLPAVKRFFHKSPWTAFINLTGVFIVLLLLLLGGTIFGICRLMIRRV